jgi:poly(3-hydroxybutyrate) depolymerase
LNAAERDTVAAEVVATDWAVTNGCPDMPSVEARLSVPSDLPVARLSWTGPNCRPVMLYRIARGGHGWPGGPQYLPPLLVGPIARLDATGIALEFAREQLVRNVDRDSQGEPHCVV